MNEVEQLFKLLEEGKKAPRTDTVLDTSIFDKPSEKKHSMPVEDLVTHKPYEPTRLQEVGARVTGQQGKERFQFWPERMVRSAFSLPVDVYRGEVDNTETLWEPNWLGEKLGIKGNTVAPGSASLVGRTFDAAGLPLMGSLPSVAIRGLAKDTLGVVPVAKAKELNIKSATPSEVLKTAAENTPGASIDADGHLVISLHRRQKPEQDGAESVRGGVFYQPGGRQSYNFTGKNNYGGSQLIEGETAYKNPLVVKGSVGGKAPEAAYDTILGKGSYEEMRKEAMSAINGIIYRREDPNMQRTLVQKFLEKYAPDLMSHADYIIDVSGKGNQLSYALQEAAVAHTVRNAGYDGVVGYGIGRKDKKPFISEVFDVRENRYPGPDGSYSVHSSLLSDTSTPATGVVAAKEIAKAPAFYSAVERAIAGSKQEVASAEQWLGYLKNQPGVRQEELATLKLDELPKGQLTKAQVEEFVKNNAVDLKENWKTGKRVENLKEEDVWRQSYAENPRRTGEAEDAWQSRVRTDALARLEELEGTKNPTKYEKWQLPGGENYRELVVGLPEKKYELIHDLKQYDKSFSSPIASIEDVALARKHNVHFAETVKGKTDQEVFDLVQKARNTPDWEAPYKSSHWDEPNPLYHVRMNDRMIGNRKSLHIEEIQSDWHQAGRKQGYKGDRNFDKLNADLEKARSDLSDVMKVILKENNLPSAAEAIAQKLPHEERAALVEKRQGIYEADQRYIDGLKEAKRLEEEAASAARAVPNAPFKKNWDELALKRVIREAVENGYDSISWTPGKAQAERYDLSKHIDKVNYVPDSSGKYRVDAFKDNKKVIEQYISSEDELAGIVGKEVAEKLVKGKNQHGASTVAGLDLKVGGEGMQKFYDKMLVDRANALAKKYGAKVEQGAISEYNVVPGYKGKWDVTYKDGGKTVQSFGTKEEAQQFANDRGNSVHKLDITDAMKKDVMEKGFPLFSAGVPTLTPVDGNPFKSKVKLTPVDFDPFAPDKV